MVHSERGLALFIKKNIIIRTGKHLFEITSLSEEENIFINFKAKIKYMKNEL